jgi:hypothetical protein
MRAVLPIVLAFEKTYQATFSEPYRTTIDDQSRVYYLWRVSGPADQRLLEQHVVEYFGVTDEPTLFGFCEWRIERASRRVSS